MCDVFLWDWNDMVVLANQGKYEQLHNDITYLLKLDSGNDEIWWERFSLWLFDKI